MVLVILPTKHVDGRHLTHVKKQMSELGSPHIRAVQLRDHYVAIEGNHRLIAAVETQTPVKLKVVTRTCELDLKSIDLETHGAFGSRDIVTGDEFLMWFQSTPFPLGTRAVKVDPL